MLPAAIEQERVFVAERLLFEIERRHGLPHPAQREIHPVIVDRFLTAYLPETRDGEPAPLALVARPHVVVDRDRHDRHRMILAQDDAQAVRERELFDRDGGQCGR